MIRFNFTRHGVSVHRRYMQNEQLASLCWGRGGVSLYYWTAPHRLWSAHLCPRLMFGRKHIIGTVLGFVFTYSFGPVSLAFCDVWSRKYAK